MVIDSNMQIVEHMSNYSMVVTARNVTGLLSSASNVYTMTIDSISRTIEYAALYLFM